MRAVRLLGAVAMTIAAVGACSSFGDASSTEPHEAETDAAVPDALVNPSDDASGSEDGAPKVDSGVPCDRTAPFTSIRPLEDVNTAAHEAFPRVSPDEHVIYFERFAGSDASAIYRASRATVGGAFGTPTKVEGLPDLPKQPFVTADELEIFFLAPYQGRHAVWHARRNEVTHPFGAAKLHPLGEPAFARFAPFLSSDGVELFFSQHVTDENLLRTWVLPDGGLGGIDSLAGINSGARDSEPALSPDRLTLYFYSEREAEKDEGSIWVAHRATPDEMFGTPTRVEELVFDGYFSSPGSVSVDNCRLYFYSNKDGSSYELYVAERFP